MSETANSECISTAVEPEKPVQSNDIVKFPPFPDPTDDDFDEDISEEERNYYKKKYPDLTTIESEKLHCSSCDRHMGCSAKQEFRMRAHPMLRTLVCHSCHTFYNSGEFEKGDDGSELYCRWCGQGGQVYCCSNCPHVFCAKCIRRNLGTPKIKEIENTDDWKCFKCNPNCLWDLRALCWALLRYCDLKNKITYKTQDPDLKEAYQKSCAIDHSICCKSKKRKVEGKKKDVDNVAKKAASILSKMPSTIQVKKFASMTPEDIKQEKKAGKRSMSPKHKPIIIKNPLTISPMPKLLNPLSMPTMAKKPRMINSPTANSIRFNNKQSTSTYQRIRPKMMPQMPIPIITNTFSQFNGFNNSSQFNNVPSDKINLSLESLTQGLDMNAVLNPSAGTSNADDDVVCTPDFPLEPLCEVTEDNTDDDVQCMTPGPVAAPKLSSNPPPLVPRAANTLPDLSADNIIQMTENDVTVNAATGGLKFRVDPQTLSSNKMYRLPDGRIFAINANPNMPGGYSATIVAVTELNAAKAPPKGATYAAKLSAVSTPNVSTTPKGNRVQTNRNAKRTPKPIKVAASKPSESSTIRQCDLIVPVEWYRYNLIDAVDALEYSLSRLQKLKKEASTLYLRTRTVNEMKNLHKTLERLLNTSASRFNEIRDNLNKELRQYLTKKSQVNSQDNNSEEEDDDDVEILPDNDDPIFIDENSMESTSGNDPHEVDLTGAGSSELNDSAENKIDDSLKEETDPLSSICEDPLNTSEHRDAVANNEEQQNIDEQQDTEEQQNTEEPQKYEENKIKRESDKENHKENNDNDDSDSEKDKHINDNNDDESMENDPSDKANNSGEDESVKDNKVNGQLLKSEVKDEELSEQENDLTEKDQNEDRKEIEDEKQLLNDKCDSQESDEKIQDTEMSEEMIETLLKDDNGGDEDDNVQTQNSNSMDVSQET